MAVKPIVIRIDPEIAPIVCMHCASKAVFMRRTPDSRGRPYEYLTFECVGCHRRVMRTVGVAPDDTQIKVQAPRTNGVSKVIS